MNLCKFRHIFGKENEGIHSIRFMNVAIVDFIGTIIIAYFLSLSFHLNFLHTLFVVFIVSILIHKLFCVRTTFTKFILD